MRRYLLVFCWLLVTAAAHAQSVNIKPTTRVVNTGALQVVMGGGNIANDGIYSDAAGTTRLVGPITYTGGGTMSAFNLVVNNGGSSILNSLFSVYNTATLTSGNFNANNFLYVRSDVNPATANMVVSGAALVNNVQGLITKATVTTGTCPVPYTSILSLNVSGTSMLYQWQSSPDNIVWSDVAGATNATYTANVTGTIYYRCFLTTNNSVYNQATMPVQLIWVSPSPAAIAGTFSVCASSTTTLTDATSGGTWSSNNAFVASISATGVVTGAGAGTATVTYNTGCGTPATAVITVNALPTQYTVSGGGPYCSGGTGSQINLDWSSTGVSYQLFIGASTFGSPVVGSNAMLGFGSITSAGTFTVQATNLVTGCKNGMIGSAVISINPLPTVYNVTGGGAYCSGGTGAAIGVSNSQTGINYQLYSGATAVGSVVAGTGGVLSLGSQTLAGTYSVRATNATTSCTVNMTGTATVSINSLPAAFNVTGGGSYCAGGSGTLVGLSGSTSGVNYQLFSGSTSIGSPQSGTGSALSFGFVTTAGTYTVMATASATSCTRAMTGNAIVSVNPVPTAYAVTGGGSFCFGGTGVPVGLGNSATGIQYQLYIGATGMGSPVAGTGAAISFGNQTSGGTYTVLASNSITGCTASMTGTAVVNVNVLPTAFTVSGGGSYCAGSAGLAVGLGGSNTGVNYQLYNGSTATGSPVAGTGSSISFGTLTAAGTYTVQAINASTLCTAGMTGSTSIIVNPVPTVYSVSGGGSLCAGSTGVAVNITGSNTGINYTLYNGSLPVGSAVAGTGSAINFGNQTAAGTYTVQAANATTACTSGMSGSAVVVVNVLPTPYAMSGGGSYCAGGTGVTVSLANSNTGINYQLYNGATAVGAAVAGTGIGISFGLQTSAGTYSVVARNTTTNCPNNMTGTVSVVINPLPTSFTVTGGGSFCAGGTGVAVGLSNSAAGVTYQLYNGAATVGSTVTGTGGALNFGLMTAAGNYSVLATITATSCTAPMSGISVVVVNPLPTAFSISGGGAYCSGGTGVSISLGGSTSGVNYQLYNGSSPVSLVGGTGSSLNFGLFTSAGTYSIGASNAATGCTANMTGTATVSVNTTPAAFSMTGGGAYCAGGTGMAVGLGGSASGVNYQLYRGATALGAAVPGTGSSLNFGLQTVAGIYSVVATNASTGCGANMTGTATIIVNPLPTAYTVTGGGSYCAGGTGVAVGLSGSVVGVTYQLFNGSTAVGSPAFGTGIALDFGLRTSAGAYTVSAVDVATTCTNNMTGSVTVSINATPNVYAMTGGGAYCAGAAGVNVGLALSQSGITYQLYNTGIPTGSPVAGTGGALNFGVMSTAGTYSVKATNSTTACTSNMSGSSVVSINSLPTAYTVTGGGSYCSGGTGVAVGLSASATGINYQLALGSTPMSGLVSGTGSTLNFGLQTMAGTYTVVGTNATTGCSSAMSGSASVIMNITPSVFAVTGGGSYCAGTGGVTIGVSNTEAGVNYQLYNGASATGGIMSGVGAAVSFGSYTAPGIYTVMATNATSGCQVSMSGFADVTMNALPLVYTITGGGSYCAGGTGVVVGLSNTQNGIDYELYNSGTTTGTIVPGTGSAITFGSQTAAGSYTVLATNTTTGCFRTMFGAATVNVNTLPAAYTVTGGGSYCAGGSGLTIGLSNSAPGTSYQLYNMSTPVGAMIAGTGGALNFGNQTSAGTYSVMATNMSTGCTNGMSGTPGVVINVLPGSFTVSAGGSYCAGGAGVVVDLSGSESGVDYTLYNGSTVISSVGGTGSLITFGAQMAAGIYSVSAVNATTGCPRTMTGSAIVNINPLPAVYAMTGGGGYCAGTSGVAVGLGGSNTGIAYQLYNGSSLSGSAIAGTGAAFSFGSFTATGIYSVLATNVTTGCTSNMSGIASVNVNMLPTVYTVAGTASSYCAGGTGVNVLLSNSEMGVQYQLYNGSSATGSPVTGTGAILDFGPQTAAGTYMVVATNATTGCTVNMGGTAAISINPLPVIYNVGGGGAYCAGGAGSNVTLSGSNLGISYQLYQGSTAIGSAVPGSGSALNFGPQPLAGTYTVVATNVSSSCMRNMAGNATVSINALPTAYTVNGGGSYCAGGTGSTIGLGNSATGVNYQLYNGSTALGSAVGGTTGIAISFGSQTMAGTYTVMATVAATGCTQAMTGSAVVSINSVPDAYAVTGGGAYCAPGAGVGVGLGNSALSVVYQLYNGSIPVGGVVAGTGSAFSFGSQTLSGTYVVVATNAAMCTVNMTGSATVVANLAPTAYTVTGGGSYCAGGTGMAVGLSSSTTGVRYQLYNGTATVGGPIGGTGGALTFGLQTAAGSYSVYATNIVTTCTNDMSGTVNVSITPTVTPSVTISTGTGDSVCLGSLITFTANPVNGGLTPAYAWEVNGVNVGFGGSAYTYVPSNGDMVSVALTSSAACATPSVVSSSRTMTVLTHQVPVAGVSVSPNDTVCAGTPVTFTSSILYGGNAPTYKWFVNGTLMAGTPNYTYVPTNGDIVKYTLHSDYMCLIANDISSTPVTMTVDNSTVPVVNITATPGFAVTSGTTVTLHANVTGTSAVTYQWLLNGVNVAGATTANYTSSTFVNGDSVTCKVVNTGGCLYSGFNTVYMKVTPSAVGTVGTFAGDIRLAPNPNNGTFELKGSIETNDELIAAEVTNMLGQSIYKCEIPVSGSRFTKNISLGNTLANGMYMITLRSANGVKVISFVLEQ